MSPDVHTEAVQAALAKHKERKMAVPMPSKRRSLVVQTSMDAYTPPGMDENTALVCSQRGHRTPQLSETSAKRDEYYTWKVAVLAAAAQQKKTNQMFG